MSDAEAAPPSLSDSAVTRGGTRPPGAAVRQATMRQHNLGLVLDEVLSAPKPLSRADLAARTGLTRATVSSLVELLLAADLLAELAPVTPQGAGRPAVPLTAARGTVAALGLVVNVDYLGVRAIDLSGDVLIDRLQAGDFRGSDPTPVMERAARLVREVLDHLADGPRIVGLGIALPGLVATDTRSLRIAPNLGWRDVDLDALFAHRAFDGLPIVADNEANLAARAEIQARQEPAPDFVYVNGEVGVGGALVQGGALFVGPYGSAGEIGHLTVAPDGPACPCGSVGCLEQYAGMDAMLRAAGLPTGTSAADLATRAAAGDEPAVAATARAGWALGIALANTFNLVAVHRVVLAGNFAVIAAHVQPAVRAELRRHGLLSAWVAPQIDVAVALDHPAMTGAALAALEPVVRDPAAWIA